MFFGNRWKERVRDAESRIIILEREMKNLRAYCHRKFFNFDHADDEEEIIEDPNASIFGLGRTDKHKN